MIIAIDPGANGGIATFFQQPEVVKMPATDREIMEVLNHPKAIRGDGTVYLEEIVKHVGTRPMPASSMATYAGNQGFCRGALTAFGYRIVIVPPKAWQKALGLGESKSHANHNKWKNHLKNRAEQLFPQLKVTLATADALLILEAARRGLIG